MRPSIVFQFFQYCRIRGRFEKAGRHRIQGKVGGKSGEKKDGLGYIRIKKIKGGEWSLRFNATTCSQLKARKVKHPGGHKTLLRREEALRTEPPKVWKRRQHCWAKSEAARLFMLVCMHVASSRSRTPYRLEDLSPSTGRKTTSSLRRKSTMTQ